MSGTSGGGPAAVPEEAWLLALAALPGVGPTRLRALVEAWGARQAWSRLVRGAGLAHPVVEQALGGRLAGLESAWRRAARATDPAEVLAAHRAAGHRVLAFGCAGYPPSLAADPDPPLVLFARGDPALLSRPTVAIVGTRRCTRYGHDVARTLGRELTEAGVAVVSGLAAGIDAAAHAGAFEAATGPAPVGVVGSGLDVPYPASNRALWARVAAEGLLLSESPLGTLPEPWRFPARNRIIAALSKVVVVVESAARGGALLTAGEALDRDVTVMAVPGPVSSRASAGANRLLADGAEVALDTESVLLAAGVAPRPAPRTIGGPGTCPPDADEQVLLDALGFEARSLAELAERVPWPVGRLAGALEALQARGLVTRHDGWFEQVAAR